MPDSAEKARSFWDELNHFGLGGFYGLLVWANLRIVADSGSSDVAGLF